ncbi:hypothetical protein [Bathymodiolus japonicus methanotrophic gill symbiont]|uniref:hypothetical protein n=1 Tax=Bathymodiolus japonicus methanotrophic gill symbiont TaxID=113269 RepID=UPI001C8EA8A9|nr:hypothetical protein [Bathymodiolus japonicus methanotrophic gill symbiont]
MLKDLPLSEHIHQHCNEIMERALLAERHPLWARSCPELKDIDFIRLGLLRCISVVDSGRHFLQTNDWGVAIFAKACFGHPSPSKQQKLNATTYASGGPDSSSSPRPDPTRGRNIGSK